MKQDQLAIFQNSLLPALWRQLGFDVMGTCGSSIGLRADLYSLSEDEYYVYLDLPMPGIQEKDIYLSLDREALRVSAEAPRETPPAGSDTRRYYEKANYSYAFTFPLPQQIDSTLQPDVSYQNGILSIQFQKGSRQATEMRLFKR